MSESDSDISDQLGDLQQADEEWEEWAGGKGEGASVIAAGSVGRLQPMQRVDDVPLLLLSQLSK
jgi:hypothetical protein